MYQSTQVKYKRQTGSSIEPPEKFSTNKISRLWTDDLYSAQPTAHNVRVRKIQRRQFVAPASRRLLRAHLARAAFSGKPAICFSKSLFLKILPVSPMDSGFCERKGCSFQRKSFINKILQVLDQTLFCHPKPSRTSSTASRFAQRPCVLPVRSQSLRPTPRDGT